MKKNEKKKENNSEKEKTENMQKIIHYKQRDVNSKKKRKTKWK